MKNQSSSNDALHLARKANEAAIREHELAHTLRLTQQAQQAQTPSNKPTPTKPPAQPKPMTQPSNPQPPQQPAPERPTAPLYQSAAPASTAIFHWQEFSYTCVPCSRLKLGMQLVELCLQEGKAQQESASLGKRTWLSRVDKCDERCSICQRRICS
jgi:hypothetical protein